jgi:hypothetical protein
MRAKLAGVPRFEGTRLAGGVLTKMQGHKMKLVASTCTLALIGASSLLAACGDDGGSSNCLGGGHGEVATCGPWASDVPEGGEFRIELQKFGGDGATTAATHGYFFKDQTPARRELEGPQSFPGTRCTDATGGVYFDNGSPTAAVQLVATRTYLDIGASASIKSANQSFTLDKQLNTMDLSSYLTHGIVYLPASSDGTNNLRNQGYTVEWDAAGELGPMEMSEPTAVQGYSSTAQLFVPPEMTNMSPAFDQPLQIPATGDWTLTYDLPATPADAPPLLHFIVFYNTDAAGVDYQCVGDATGTVTVPRALLDKAASTGYIYFGTFAHVGSFQQQRRLDLVGVTCTYNEYTK